MRVLQKMHAISRDLLFDSKDTGALQTAFDPTWESAVPYTMLIASDPQDPVPKQVSVDILELRDDSGELAAEL